MIEIIILIFLCRANYKNAAARGKSGGLYILITLALWILLEVIGIYIGMHLSTYPNMLQTVIFGLLFAIFGGIISYYLAKSGPVINRAQEKNNQTTHPKKEMINKDSDNDSNLIV